MATLPFLPPSTPNTTLVVRPVQHADVEQCVNIRVKTLGSLVIGRPPPYPGYVENSIASLHTDIEKDESHIRHLKVVDLEGDQHEVIAYAKWEIYHHGRNDLESLSRPMQEGSGEVDEFGGLREAAHEYFGRCNGEMGKRPHIRQSGWILTIIFFS